MTTPLLARYTAALTTLANTSSKPTPTRPATPQELDALRQLGMRDPVLSLYAHASLAKMLESTIRVHAPETILFEHNELCPGNEIGPLGFVVVGSSHCGDVFALDYNSPPAADGTPRVLLVSHEYGYETADDVLEEPTVVAASFIEFLEGAAEDRFDF